MVTFRKNETVNSKFVAVEYEMSKEMADMFIKNSKSNKAKSNPQQYLVDLVNEQFGVKGTCVKVNVY